MANEPVSQTSVSVFGGGVAGLTAAHELAERGFRVLVIEPTLTTPDTTARIDGFGELPAALGEVGCGQLGAFWLPGCPRHLLDSMKRIPLGPNADRLQTVVDHLVPIEPRAIRGGTRESFLLLPGAAASATDVYLQLRKLLDDSFGALDVQMLFVRALRYLTSCSDRREKECQGASLVDYLCGREAPSGLPAFRFGPAALARIGSESLLMTGVEASYSEARAALNAILQLHFGVLPEGAIRSGLLQGSIEEAWLAPWREHLKALGVHFQCGELTALYVATDTRKIRAQVDWYGDPPASEYFPSDYQVVATDVVSAERTTRSLRADAGVPADLQGFTTVLSGDPRQSERSRHVGRDPTSIAELGRKPWDRLRLDPYIEFILSATVPALSGVVYLVDSPWSLECVSGPPPGTWTTEPVGPRPESVLRVTLRRFRAPDEGSVPVTEYTNQSFAREVWSQIERCICLPDGSQQPLLAPIAFRLDRRLDFEAGRVSSCRAANVFPIAGDWARRPEGEPCAPGSSIAVGQPPQAELWSEGGYLVHYGSLVFAGPYMKTLTRLSDAESANESARHAVNAILAHRVHAFTPSADSPASDYCSIWNPETSEPPQFLPSKSLDQQLFGQGLPHLWDLLGLELLPRLASQRADQDDSLLRLLSVFEGFAATASNPSNSGSVLDVLKTIRQYLERQVMHGAGAEHTPTAQ